MRTSWEETPDIEPIADLMEEHEKIRKELAEEAEEFISRTKKALSSLKRFTKSTEETTGGIIEVVGINGRYAYIDKVDGKVVWRVFSNDGQEIAKGDAKYDTIWENRLKSVMLKLMGSVVANEGRVSHIAKLITG